ncbi:DUF7845 domain-containing protein [Natronococcus wangiae]
MKPYYALTDVGKSHDWSTNGKPCGTFEAGGETWRVCLDYDDQPLPRVDPSCELGTERVNGEHVTSEREGTFPAPAGVRSP